uniref:Dynein axonemal assembly factor 8 n=1 Tax=Sus scrofa TaxID=9823 RepID=A0A8D1DVM5_PIG
MGPAPMAFHNKDVGPLSPSPWDAILEAVREQLPSLDSDSSLSDCEEEELFIFQRDQTTLIPDLSEELAEDCARPWVTPSGFPPEPAVHVEPTPEPWRDYSPRLRESASLEGRAPGGPLQSCGQSSSHLRMPVEAAAWQEDEGGKSFNTSASQSGSQGPQGQATLPPGEAALQTEGPGAASGAPAGSDSTNHRSLRRERRKMIERDILHKVTRSARHPACQDPSPVEETPRDTAEKPPEGPQRGLPMRSLQQLEEWDLDQVLQSLTGREDDQGDGTPGATCWAADHLEGQAQESKGAVSPLSCLPSPQTTRSRAHRTGSWNGSSSCVPGSPELLLLPRGHLLTRPRTSSRRLEAAPAPAPPTARRRKRRRRQLRETRRAQCGSGTARARVSFSSSSGHFRRPRLSPNCRPARIPATRRLRALETQPDPALWRSNTAPSGPRGRAPRPDTQKEVSGPWGTLLGQGQPGRIWYPLWANCRCLC